MSPAALADVRPAPAAVPRAARSKRRSGWPCPGSCTSSGSRRLTRGRAECLAAPVSPPRGLRGDDGARAVGSPPQADRLVPRCKAPVVVAGFALPRALPPAWPSHPVRQAATRSNSAHGRGSAGRPTETIGGTGPPGSDVSRSPTSPLDVRRRLPVRRQGGGCPGLAASGSTAPGVRPGSYSALCAAHERTARK